MTYREQVREIALDQYGLVSIADAAAADIPAVELRKLASRGALERVGRGVYRDPGVPGTMRDQYAQAVLLVGPDAYLTGESVLALHDLALVNPSHIHVGTPHRVRTRLPRVVRALRRKLPPEALTVDEGIPSTTVFQAIDDCMATVVSERLRDAIAVAGRQGLITLREQAVLRARLSRRYRRMGA